VVLKSTFSGDTLHFITEGIGTLPGSAEVMRLTKSLQI
jgi:hypothetical protein